MTLFLFLFTFNTTDTAETRNTYVMSGAWSVHLHRHVSSELTSLQSFQDSPISGFPELHDVCHQIWMSAGNDRKNKTNRKAEVIRDEQGVMLQHCCSPNTHRPGPQSAPEIQTRFISLFWPFASLICCASPASSVVCPSTCAPAFSPRIKPALAASMPGGSKPALVKLCVIPKTQNVQNRPNSLFTYTWAAPSAKEEQAECGPPAVIGGWRRREFCKQTILSVDSVVDQLAINTRTK